MTLGKGAEAREVVGLEIKASVLCGLSKQQEDMNPSERFILFNSE